MFLSKIAKVLFLAVFITVVSAETNARSNGAKSFDWGHLMDAITQVESEGDSRARSGQSCGAMQITPILVKDCNAILKKRGENKRYNLNDRFNVKKSREIGRASCR